MQFLQLGSARLHLLLLLPLALLLKFQLCAGEAARLESTPVQALINYGRLGTMAGGRSGSSWGRMCVFASARPGMRWPVPFTSLGKS